MRRAGGVFVGAFFIAGGLYATTDVMPGDSGTASAVSAPETAKVQNVKFTGNAGPIRPGSLPYKRWEELVNKWGNKCKGLTPAILAGQLHQESMGFNRDVVAGRLNSPAGARGIAQFMPATWRSSGIDGDGDGDRDILDPEDAIPSAATYDCAVAGSVKNVPGDPIANMLAGYNAGAHRVKQYQGVPPYSETQNYVRIIKRKAGGYEQ